jgi:hypothetical protein
LPDAFAKYYREAWPRRSIELPNRVQKGARDTFVVDGPQDLVQRVLLSLEGFLADAGQNVRQRLAAVE